MNRTSLPLVSIVTPVYNGAQYLAECIESVLKQTYQHWEYLIVNNCSTDSTLEIARQYANCDRRIRVHDCREFANLIDNHNRAVNMISPESGYCKILCADDWLYSDCLLKLVEIGECNPAVSIIGSYAINERGVNSLGLPPTIQVFDGRSICRSYLQGAIDSFGTPSTVLYRSAVIRSRVPFFPGPAPNADLAACLICLRTGDFGFVHQILSFNRLHLGAVSATIQDLHSFLLDRIEFVMKYGPMYLDEKERSVRLDELLKEYNECLAAAFINREGRGFWEFQKRRLGELGYSIYSARLARALAEKAADLLLNPKKTAGKIIRRLRNASSVRDADSSPRRQAVS
jgi:glycosyltransferase involved in cell wall biosynthesis